MTGCPALPACRYGGPGTPPICTTYCGDQHGDIWSEVSGLDLGWPEKNALFEQRKRDELIPLDQLQEGTPMTSTTPTPEEFMLLAPGEPDEDFEHEPAPVVFTDPYFQRLERRISVLEEHVGLTNRTAGPIDFARVSTPAADSGLAEDYKLAAADRQALTEQLADLEAKHDVVLQLVERIAGTVKKSTSKVSLEVKAAIDEWANPETPSPAPGDSAPEPQPEPIPAAVAEASAGEGPRPDDAANVETWRSYAGSLGFTGDDVDQMNRSQIRTMLGIEQPVLAVD